MLNRVRALLICHRNALLASYRGLLRTPAATMMTVLMIAIALMLPLLLGVFIDKLKSLTVDWQEGEHISLYLKIPLPESATTAVVSKVQQMQGVASAVYISPQEGLVSLQQQEGMQDVMQYLPNNPLPGVIDVTPHTGLSPEVLDQLYRTLKAYPEVAQAKVDMAWVKRLHALLTLFNQIACALMVLLGSALVFIVGNTLRVAIQKSCEEIKVLKLIGATDAFIARPFLYTGVLFGLGGAFCALALLQLFVYSISSAMEHVLYLYQMNSLSLGLSFAKVSNLMLMAVFLGWIGARFSIKKQLKHIEIVS